MATLEHSNNNLSNNEDDEDLVREALGMIDDNFADCDKEVLSGEESSRAISIQGEEEEINQMLLCADIQYGDREESSDDEDDPWHKRYMELKESKIIRKGVVVDWKTNKELAVWAQEQIDEFHSTHWGNLGRKQIKALKEIGVERKPDEIVDRLLASCVSPASEEDEPLISVPNNNVPKHSSAKRENKYSRIWNHHYGELEEYFERHGNTLVPFKYEQNPKLGRWVTKQRVEYRKEGHGDLTEDRIRLLDDLQFEWFTKASKNTLFNSEEWSQNFAALQKFHRQRGHCLVPTRYAYNPGLAAWVKMVRAQYKLQNHGCLTDEQIKSLESLGFLWQKPRYQGGTQGQARWSKQWNQRYNELLEYKRIHGDCLVPTKYPENPILGQWVLTQRSRFKMEHHGYLSDERIRMLNEIGFHWSANDPWYARYHQLREYRKRNGNCLVGAEPGLRQWIELQRLEYAKKLLIPDKTYLLNMIQFEWNAQLPEACSWLKMYYELTAFQRQYGHCQVPSGYESNPRLAKWVETQRTEFQKVDFGCLTLEQIINLDVIGFFQFQWDPVQAEYTPRIRVPEYWFDKYQELQDYFTANGHSSIPRGHANTQLVAFVSDQRRDYKKVGHGQLSELQIRLLDKLEFKWMVEDDGTTWDTRYLELRSYRQKHGTCAVRHEENEALARWVSEQQREYEAEDHGTLTEENVRLLNELDFEWNVSSPADLEHWQTMFEQLQEFKRTHGHCVVPTGYEFNPALADWVKRQRSDFHKNGHGNLTEEQIKGLNDSGFLWDDLPQHRIDEYSSLVSQRWTETWYTRYEELQDYMEANGNSLVPFKYPANKKLGQWVATQRKEYRKPFHGFLKPERIKLLNDIGFQWVVGNARIRSAGGKEAKQQSGMVRQITSDGGAKRPAVNRGEENTVKKQKLG